MNLCFGAALEAETSFFARSLDAVLQRNAELEAENARLRRRLSEMQKDMEVQKRPPAGSRKEPRAGHGPASTSMARSSSESASTGYKPEVPIWAEYKESNRCTNMKHHRNILSKYQYF